MCFKMRTRTATVLGSTLLPLTRFPSQSFAELWRQDGLIVMARGLGVRRLLAKFLLLHCMHGDVPSPPSALEEVQFPTRGTILQEKTEYVVKEGQSKLLRLLFVYIIFYRSSPYTVQYHTVIYMYILCTGNPMLHSVNCSSHVVFPPFFHHSIGSTRLCHDPLVTGLFIIFPFSERRGGGVRGVVFNVSMFTKSLTVLAFWDQYAPGPLS